jgi:hypothetical protein
MERSFTDLSWLAEQTQVKMELLEPGFEMRVIIPPATTLYDCQPCYVDDDGSMVITDIGGQAQPGWDPIKGHGAVFKLHPDNRIEYLVPYGNTGRAQIMSTIRSPANFGEYSNRPFPLGQMRPGRDGAHNTHCQYWVPPGANWIEHYVVMPDAGSINGGKSGALVSALTTTAGSTVSSGFGTPGTPEDGYLFLVSMYNCTLYKVTSKRTVWPLIIGDVAHSGIQFMPRSLYRAPSTWGSHAGQLICEGVQNHSFTRPAPMPGEPLLEEKIVYFVVEDQGEGRLAKITQIDTSSYPRVLICDPEVIAPEGFGNFGGQIFQTDMGSVNLMQTTMMPDGALPYDASIYRIDANGNKHLFAKNLQGGFPVAKFQGNRLILGTIGKSYSTGDFHYPDGSLIEIFYTGKK